MPTFENCEIFSTYYFSYVRGYKAPLRGGNYSSNIRTLASESSENVFLFAFILLFVSYVTLFSRTVIIIWFKLQIENIYWTYSKEGQKLIKGICYRKAFGQWETLSENYKPIIANCNCNCSLRYFVKIIQTQKRYPTSLDKISILTWMLIVISSQNFSYKLNFENFPAGIYMFKVNNRNTRTRYKICSKLTIKTPKRWCCSSFIVNLEHILYYVLVFLLLTLSR